MRMKAKRYLIAVSLLLTTSVMAGDYPIVDTGQIDCYNVSQPMEAPDPGEEFYGQDAQYNEIQLSPQYRDNGDGTVSDINTGLMWVQARGDKMSWTNAYEGAAECEVGGYDDWRMPTIKELYSLILFTGNTQPTIEASTPFLNADYFGFEYGDEDMGERIIDCQDWSATEYIGLTMGGDTTVFGVNFADGRIKGYPKYRREQNMADNKLYVRYVRGNSDYGTNDFVDNQDGTLSDRATGLMWMQSDSETGMNWQEALVWVQEKNNEEYLGYSDWRLPNAKELQSLLDYSEAPKVTGNPAIDPVFDCSEIEVEDGSEDYPFYWTNTTHMDGPGDQQYRKAVYLCFGTAYGWMQPPPRFEWKLLDVHGAGAQRSDPKEGDAEDYPHGFGPQGDVIRVDNYVRMVRGESDPYSVVEDRSELPTGTLLIKSYPNPFNSSTTIEYYLDKTGPVKLNIFTLNGEFVTQVYKSVQKLGNHSLIWDASWLPTGGYLLKVSTPLNTSVQKLTLIK
ncbi:DUF1566 domain-containing protein [Calditrichota bacterium]